MHRIPHIFVVAAALAAALAFGMSASAGTGSFTDPTGDGNGAPDITGLSMTSDASGTVQLTLTVTGLEATDPAKEPEVGVFFDTDKNESTGSQGGNEYFLDYWRTVDDSGWDLEKWNGTKYEQAPASQTLTFSRSGGTLTWRFSSKTDIVTSGFEFYAVALIFDASGNVVARDDAPDDGVWTFDAGAAVIAPAIGKPLAVPARPVHSKLFSLSFPITRTDTGEPLEGGTLSVTTTIAGKAVAKNASLSNATAHVAVQLPARSNGKTLVVKVTVTANGKTATRTVPYLIR